MDLGDSSGYKRSDPGYPLKAVPTVFPDRLILWRERDSRKGSSVLEFNVWKDGIVIT